jgi:hypothetical protein
MTRSIDPREHGPLDQRQPTPRPMREAEQLGHARPAAITCAAVQAWEGEGGALLPEERPTNRETRERRGADERSVPDNLSRDCGGRHGPGKSQRASHIQIFEVREGGM